MNAPRLSELRELLRTAAFAAWWEDLVRVEAACRDAEARRRDLSTEAGLADLRAELAGRLAADAFSSAGEIESQAAHLGAEAQQLENRALERVAEFEELRNRVSGLWYRLGDAERVLEESREASAAAQSAGERGPGQPSQARAQLEQAERQHLAAREEYERQAGEKARLWAEVESDWERSFELSLLAAERRDSVRGVRRDAERLFEEAEGETSRARGLREAAAAVAREGEQAAGRREELLVQASSQFRCFAGRRCLYWRRRDDPKGAWAVPFDGKGTGPGASEPEVFAASASRGELRLEPAREELAAAPDEGEHRFEEWLLGLRRGSP